MPLMIRADCRPFQFLRAQHTAPVRLNISFLNELGKIPKPLHFEISKRNYFHNAGKEIPGELSAYSRAKEAAFTLTRMTANYLLTQPFRWRHNRARVRKSPAVIFMIVQG